MEERQRRRLGSGSPVESMEAFTGQPTETLRGSEAAEERGDRSLDDDLDPSGKPYRPATNDREADPKLTGDWGRIVRTVFKIDEGSVFAQLKKVTFLKRPSQMSYGELVDALDDCSGNAILAAQLAENAKQVLKQYEDDVAVLRAPMHKAAKAALAAEKKAEGGKQITNEDVQMKIAEMYPAEHGRQEENLAKARGTVSFIKALGERWSYRCREIESIVKTTRQT